MPKFEDRQIRHDLSAILSGLRTLRSVYMSKPELGEDLLHELTQQVEALVRDMSDAKHNSVFTSVDVGEAGVALIDDNESVRRVWKIHADDLRVKLAASESEDQFMSNSLSTETAVFVDKRLGDVCGIEVAARLFNHGYQNIYLTTGEKDVANSRYGFIKGVFGKEFPTKYIKFRHKEGRRNG